MRSFVTQPVRRLMMMALAALCVLSTAAVASAQDPPPQPAAPAAPAAPDALKFTTPSAMVFNVIKADKTADFEAAWTEIKKGLAASSKPELQQQAASLKMFKLAVDMPAGQNPIYVFYIEPVPSTTFDPTKILFESGAFERAKADELYAKLKDSYAEIRPWPLVTFGG
jgi:hypothetical protein